MTYAVTTTHEATLSNFVGTHINGCNKEVVCITTRQRWVSITDAANAEGVAPMTMSSWVNGTRKPRNGKQYCLAKELNKHLDTMLTEDAEYAEIKRKAAAYDALMAEMQKEAALKNSLQEAIAEAEKTVEHCKRIAERTEVAHTKAMHRVMEAETELAKLSNMSTAEWKAYSNNPKMRQKRYNRNAYMKHKAKRNAND